MRRKFVISFVLFLALAAGLKFGVDGCLPFRESALFERVFEDEHPICQVLTEWDSHARYAQFRVLRGYTTFPNAAESGAVDPSRVMMTDPFLFWRVVEILPLVLEETPILSAATQKLFLLCLSLSFLLAIAWRFLEEFFRILDDFLRMERRLEDEDPEVVQGLLGRNSSQKKFHS